MAFELKNNIICFDLALLESELQELSLLNRPPDVRIHVDKVQKLGNYSATQILREINFCECGVSKSAILTILTPLNFGFSKFLHFPEAETHQNHKFRALEIVKMAFFEH